MRHFVQYHITEKKGELGRDIDGFDVWTDKVFKDLIGSTVWLIAGEGGIPRRYSLAYRFIVEVIDSAPPDSEKKFRPFGHDGVRFEPKLRLDTLPWWSEFFESQGRSGFGLNPLQDRFVGKIETLERFS